MPFDIPAPATELLPALRAKLDGKTKPPGSLGRIETLALQAGLAQGTLTPRIANPHMLICAGDHGALRDPRGRGLSAFPADVTWQMVENFLAGGAAINVFAREAGLQLKVADAGVAHDFGARAGLIDAKVAPGTASWFDGPAMTLAQRDLAIERGATIVRELARDGCNVLGLGEMGIGNTASAALITHFVTGASIAECTGRGTGLNDAGLALKRELLSILSRAYAGPRDGATLLAQFGGFELAMLTGAMLAAAEARMLILIDGFIVTAALLAALSIAPRVRSYCVFSHRSEEHGHTLQLMHLGVTPLLELDLRLGEGTGAALAFPLLRAAVAMLNDMASFADAGVSNREAQ